MFEKLVNIQSKLKAPKSQLNKFGNYKYRNCEDILEALKPLLSETGLFLVINDDITLIGDRFYVKATATVSDGTNTISATAYAREAADKKGMDASQVTGAASSYARKYALNGLFCIDDTEDADSDNKETDKRKSFAEVHSPAPASGGDAMMEEVKETTEQVFNSMGVEDKPITDSQRKRLFAIAKEHNIAVDKVKTLLKKEGIITESTNEITNNSYDWAIETIKKGAA